MVGDKTKSLIWVGSARKDLRKFPKPAQREVGQVLYAAQRGETYPVVKPLKGFGGRSVLEIVTYHASDTYRAVYTVRYSDALYVLHVFQKKSKGGVRRPDRKSS